MATSLYILRREYPELASVTATDAEYQLSVAEADLDPQIWSTSWQLGSVHLAAHRLILNERARDLGIAAPTGSQSEPQEFKSRALVRFQQLAATVPCTPLVVVPWAVY